LILCQVCCIDSQLHLLRDGCRVVREKLKEAAEAIPEGKLSAAC